MIGGGKSGNSQKITKDYKSENGPSVAVLLILDTLLDTPYEGRPSFP